MIKRPMIFITAAYALGILLYESPISTFVAVFVCTVVLCYIYEHGKYCSIFIFLCPVFIMVGSIYTDKMSEMPVIYDTFEDSMDVKIQGTVDTITEKEKSIAVCLKNVYFEKEDTVVESVLAYFNKDSDVIIGDRISVSGELSKFEKPGNTGQFDEFDYYVRQQGNYFKLFVSEYKSLSGNSKSDIGYILSNSQLHIWSKGYYVIKACLFKVKKVLTNILVQVFKDEAGVICAMILGEKSLMDEDIKNLYMENGISHVLAISGLHLSLIGATLYRFLLKTGMNLYIGSFISIVIVLLYGIMTDFSTSTNRAVVMLIIMILARCIGKTYDILTTLSISALIILIQNPFLIYSSGFLLSFLAVIAVSQINPMLIKSFKLEQNIVNVRTGLNVDEETGEIVDNRYFINRYDFINKVIYYVKLSLVSGISVNILTLPIVLNTYYEVSIFSLILNVVVIPLMSIVVGMSVLVCFIGLFSIEMASLTGGSVYYIIKLFEGMCRLGSSMDFMIIRTGKLSLIKVIVYILAVTSYILICYFKSSNSSHIYRLIKSKVVLVIVRKIRRIHFNPVVILLGCLVAFMPKIFYKFEIEMLDVGQGQCIFIQMEDGTKMLYDCGSTDVSDVAKYRVIPYLKSKGIKEIDYAFVSHMDGDHISGFEEILENDWNVNINNYILPGISNKNKTEAYTEFEECVYKSNIGITYMRDKLKISSDNWMIECLGPNKELVFTSENEYSICMMLTCDDFNMLFTGDVEGKGEKELIKSLGSDSDKVELDVLQVSHHGSKNSTLQEFIDVVDVDVAVISAGKNNRYGHPNEETIDRLKSIDATIKVTAEEGMIKIK